MTETLSVQGVLFEQRFLDNYAGSIINSTEVAIVELIANAWDAFATRVEITWPTGNDECKFSIKDNGRGMSSADFERCWGTLDYDKLFVEGNLSFPPADLEDYSPRRPYGRNGKGRHAAFHFSDPYHVITSKNGEKNIYEVKRGVKQAFEIKKIETISEDKKLRGTQITAICSTPRLGRVDNHLEFITAAVK